jgi:radical SAM superfamily enzyme YgiQ (UPF0313 family)
VSVSLQPSTEELAHPGQGPAAAQGGNRCLLVFPEFTAASFWNYRAACELMGARYPAAPLGLITVAALLPDSWNCRLVDCNVEQLRDEDIDWADVVFVGGMIAQQRASVALIADLKTRGKTVVVGGPDATASPHLYDAADSLVLGEAEITLPRWLADYEAGATAHLYQCGDGHADMTTSPLPRFDLLKPDRYLHIGIQYTRGCPYNCEFCDIIELFGRVPRPKSTTQIIRELDALYARGHRGHVDFVDDNFIGKKKDVKRLLPVLRAWQEEHGWPFEFSTEASINLADDDELLGMMRDAGFFAVFVGVETPDVGTLETAQKKQNTRRSLADSLRKIYAHGMFVNSGYIIGFDTDPPDISERMLDLIETSATPVNMVGLLFALPGTQLSRRLSREGRLGAGFDEAPDDKGDQCTAGLNFDTRQPRLEILKHYRTVIAESYAPKAYLGRVLRMGAALNCAGKRLNLPWRTRLRELRGFGRLLWRMGLRKDYWPRFWLTLVLLIWRNPRSMRYTVALMALYLHFDAFATNLVARLDAEIGLNEDSVKQSVQRSAVSYQPSALSG